MMNKKRPIIFMFSGQGSQYYEMGRVLYEQEPSFKKTLEELDAPFRSETGTSLIDLLYNLGNRISDPFNRTLYTHPSLVMIPYALCQLLKEKGTEPDAVLGISIGEFTALAVAQTLPVEEAVKLAIFQAKTVEETCEEAGMLAILAPHEIFDQYPFLHDTCEKALIPYDNLFIVSGKKEALQEAQRGLKEHSHASQILPVSHGFHSHLIDPAKKPFLSYAAKQQLKEPRLSLFSPLHPKEPLKKISPTHLWECIHKPHNFQQFILDLEAKNAYSYVDLSPSGVLATHLKYILPKESPSSVHQVLSPYKPSKPMFPVISP